MQLELTPIIEDAKPVVVTPRQMELGIKEEPMLSYTVGTTINAYAWNSPKNVVFSGKDNKECGRFSWDDGVFRFQGDAEPSAKLFAEHIAKFLGMKLPT